MFCYIQLNLGIFIEHFSSVYKVCNKPADLMVFPPCPLF